MKESVVKPCRLCLQTKELSFSHIIPNLFFRKLRRDDKSGQALYLSMDNTPCKIEGCELCRRFHLPPIDDLLNFRARIYVKLSPQV